MISQGVLKLPETLFRLLDEFVDSFLRPLVGGPGADTPIPHRVVASLAASESMSPCLAQAASRIGKQLSVTVPISRMVVMILIASSGRPARHQAGWSQALHGEKAPTMRRRIEFFP
jgi:hypothetical protein